MANKSLHSHKAALLDAVSDVNAVLCRIPGAEEPVDLGRGLRWLERSLREGFAVDFRVARDGDEAEVSLLRWPLDEPRPDWPEDWDDWSDRDEVREAD